MNKYFPVGFFMSKTLLYVVGATVTKAHLPVMWLVCLPWIVKVDCISNNKLMELLLFGFYPPGINTTLQAEVKWF